MMTRSNFAKEVSPTMKRAPKKGVKKVAKKTAPKPAWMRNK